MLLCYLDEAGCTGRLPDATSSVQPVFVLTGLIVPHAELRSLTHAFLGWKRRFFPGMLRPYWHELDHMLVEIKGASLRGLVKGSTHKRKAAMTQLDALIHLMEVHGAQIIGRVWIKEMGASFDGRAVYTSSVQAILEGFEHRCESTRQLGHVIADNRDHHLNQQVAHSVFTQLFKREGSAYPHLTEMPTFGQSENHAGLQLCDLICSAIIFPIAATVYSRPYMQNRTHCSLSMLHLRGQFGSRLERLQYRYWDVLGERKLGGLVVSDPLGQLSGSHLFKDVEGLKQG